MSRIEQKQQLHQKLNPKQILEASLFQLNAFSLEQRIYHELEKNPLLELSDDLNDSSSEEIQEEEDDFEFDELYSNTDDFELSKNQRSKQDMLESTAANKRDQLDFLKDQIKDLNLNTLREKVAYDIVENLDQKGYLAIEPILIADRFDMNIDEVMDIQKQIRLLDPPGVSSLDIRECLLSQLESHSYNNSDAFRIISDHFKDFSKANYDKISKDLNISKDQIKEALEIISNLYLYPADNVDQAAKETILPDLIMEKREGEWVISVNDSSTPELILNKKYTDMIKDKKIASKTKTFIKKNYQSAEFFLSAIKQRNKTMIRVMEQISRRQSNYFNSDKKVLKPMILKDIAQDIDMDISTVSRICNGKYVQLPWGIFELRFFFNEGVKLKDGSVISSTVLDQDIIQIINNESISQPLKDEEIGKILNEKGYEIARRTISKYREKLNIPSSLIRKKIKGLKK